MTFVCQRLVSTALFVSKASVEVNIWGQLIRPAGILLLAIPLVTVAFEPVASYEAKRWAIKELFRMFSATGYRQAKLIAEQAEQILNSSVADIAS